jgi:hypothetical protein
MGSFRSDLSGKQRSRIWFTRFDSRLVLACSYWFTLVGTHITNDATKNPLDDTIQSADDWEEEVFYSHK